MKARKRGYAPPFDTQSRWFKHSAMASSFPFDTIEENALKLRNTPIQLCWGWRRRSSSVDAISRRVTMVAEEETNCRAAVEFDTAIDGQFQNCRWFRSPPKVQIMAGILGPGPALCTHVSNLGVGEHKVEDDPESGHLPGGAQETARTGCISSDCDSPKSPTAFPSQTLAKFVGVILSPTVKMQPRGAGRRGGFGQGREGFGGGRHGRGRGEDGWKAQHLEAPG